MSLRILVVDDNIDSATTLGRLLSLKGYEAHWVHSGRSALETLPEFDPMSCFSTWACRN